MKKTISLCAAVAAAMGLNAAEFFVAPSVSVQKEPQVVATSVADALKAAKKYRSTHPDEAIDLVFYAGEYPLTETIYVTPELNNLTLRAAPGAAVVFDGGKKLRCKGKAQLNGKEVLIFDVPKEAICNGFLDQFYVNGVRAEAARTPKSYHTLLSPEKLLPESVEEDKVALVYKEGEFNPKWYNPAGIDVQLFSHWIAPHVPFDQVIVADREIRFKDPVKLWSIPAQTGMIFRNVREALTEKGEYYFDNQKMELYYIPRDGESAESMDAVVSVNGLLFVAAGDEAKGKKISGITVDGITFRHGGVGRPDYRDLYRFSGAEKYPPLHNEFNRIRKSRQAACYAPAVIAIQYADHCRVVNCRVEHSNFYAIGALSGVTDSEFRCNVITDMGAGGVIVNGVNLEKTPQFAHLLTENVSILDNHIYDCGKFDFAGVGILIGFARGNLVEHNLIHDLYYSGISAGWNWGYAPATGGENRIGFNHIYNIGKKMLSDMGGIYLLGIQPGTRVYNNHIHDVSSRLYGGWALYADGGSSHEVWERNVCYDCNCDAFHQNYGRENTVRDNIFAFCGEELARISLCEASMKTEYRFPGKNFSHDFNFYRNILFSDGTPFFRASFLENFDKKELFWDCNLYFDLRHGAADALIAIKLLRADKTLPGADTIVKDTLAEWQKRGHDLHSNFADPGFVDPVKRDFHLKKDANALKLGFFDPAETLDAAGLLLKNGNRSQK